MWKLFQLLVASLLIVAGVSLMILWDNDSLSVIWTNPLSILWHDKPEHGHRLWWSLGPTLCFMGIFWIAEDWFGFGQTQDCSKDSELTSEKQKSLLAIDHAPREPLP